MTRRLLEDFSEIASDWFWETDENLRFSYFSDRFEKVTGMDPAQVLGRRREELKTVRDNPVAWRTHLENLDAHRPFRDFIYRLVRPEDGVTLWIRTNGQPVFDETGGFAGYRGVATDVTRAHENAAKLEKQNRDLLVKKATLEQVERMASIGAWDMDLSSNTMRWSQEIYRILDLPRHSVPSIGLARQAFPAKTYNKIRKALIRILRKGGQVEKTLKLVTTANNRKWVRWIAEADTIDGHATRVFGIIQDVTQERERSAEMRRLAHTDTLTGLSNRTAFQNVLKSLTGADRTEAEPFTLFLIDVDHFKHVNDFYGHDAGDEVLRFAARQLKALCGDDALIARLGGDELAVIKPQKMPDGDHVLWAEKIRDALLSPIVFNGNSIEISVSVGIAIRPEHGSTGQDIMCAADLALYHSKRCGRDQATVYDNTLTIELNERSQTLTEFRAAVCEKRIVPFYQPIVDMATGRHLGFEALLRWRHPSRGLLAPGAFACVLEEARCARIVTRTMLAAVAKDLLIWREHQLPVGKISLNLTSSDLRDDSFIDMFFPLLDETGLAAEQFIVEVTENVIFGDREKTIINRIEALSRAGVEIALDDFGTGFASLTHLQVLPVDIVKIDKTFVLKPTLSPQDIAILKAVIELGHALGFSTVAEGIEREEHFTLLKSMGCDRGQGYLFAKPMPGEDVPAYLLGNFVATGGHGSRPEGAAEEERIEPLAFGGKLR